MELFWKLNRVTDLDKRGLNSNCIGKDDGIADPIIDGHDIVPSSQSRSLTPRWAACSTSPNLALFPSLRPLSFFFLCCRLFFPLFLYIFLALTLFLSLRNGHRCLPLIILFSHIILLLVVLNALCTSSRSPPPPPSFFSSFGCYFSILSSKVRRV